MWRSRRRVALGKRCGKLALRVSAAEGVIGGSAKCSVAAARVPRA